ncbi:nitroreductase family protein [Desulfovibrio oxyclinae]|jgi:nitroreductase/NAD-dependent dihydropyrimidine dehydrogenase PreA subunit|uniref:nitroreductase family protein n=1 Tax=Desulfovibrio oxyclinae TaxID=63560 RepID=UPI000369E8DA|nr:nitroreductase family protein [Desulfovibrio oxyclinae]
MLEFTIDQEKCTKCGECVADCPRSIIELEPEFPRIKDGGEEECIRCQHCLAICKPGALSILGTSPEDCLPLDGALPTPEQMEALVRGRRSTRRYKKENVAPETVEWLMDMLAHAPTGVNNRRLLFTLVDDTETMDKIREEAFEGIRTAVQQGNLPERYAPFEQFIGAWEQGIDVPFRGAPHMIIASSPEDSPCPEADPFIALSYFELCAASKGVGTVWCGLGKYALFDIVPELGRKLGVPEDHKSVYVMLFGNPALKYHRTVKRDNTAVNRVRY